MKVLQLRKVLEEAARQKAKAGDASASRALADFSKLLIKHKQKTVRDLVKIIKSVH